MKFSPSHLSVVLAFIAGAIAACSLGSHASSGSSGISGDVSHLYLVLTGPHAIKTSTNARSTEAVTEAAQVIGCPGIGTITSDDASLPYWPIKTCTGYYANLREAPTASDTSIPLGPVASYQVLFDGPNCTGNAFAQESAGISSKALAGGFVFFMDMNGTGTDDPDNYWVIEQGEHTAAANIQSYFNGSCSASSGNPNAVYPVKHNSDVLDQDGNPASGLASAPIQGPLDSGTP